MRKLARVAKDERHFVINFWNASDACSSLKSNINAFLIYSTSASDPNCGIPVCLIYTILPSQRTVGYRSEQIAYQEEESQKYIGFLSQYVKCLTTSGGKFLKCSSFLSTHHIRDLGCQHKRSGLSLDTFPFHDVSHKMGKINIYKQQSEKHLQT